MKRQYLVFLLFSVCEIAMAQSDFLVLSKYGSTKRRYYHIGDMISLRPVNDFPIKSGFITALSDSAIYMGYTDSIMFSEIDYVFLGEKKGVLPKNLWLINLVSVSGIALFYEAPYLIKGETSPDIRNVIGVITTMTVLPLIINGSVKLFKQNKLYIRPDK